MRAAIQSFLLLLASSRDSDLRRMVEYLKHENRILRSKLPRAVPVTPQERQTLLKYGRKLGSKIRDLISIVSPRTFLRWVHAEDKRPLGKPKPGKPGRPRTPEAVRELVLKLARENAWGYTRILGELKKLGVRKVTHTTVKNILKEAGLDPGPRRGGDSWDAFLRRHAQTLWACDFFSTKVFTARGFVEVYVLFFLHVGSRRVFVAGASAQPDAAWVKQQARNALVRFAEEPVAPALLIRDGDRKFTKEFDALMRSEGVGVKRVGPRSPNMNPHAERWVQSVKQEALDHFLIVGEAHFRYLIDCYVRWYNTCRPHQSLGNRPLTGPPPPEGLDPPAPDELRCQEQLGGLLRHYSRAA